MVLLFTYELRPAQLEVTCVDPHTPFPHYLSYAWCLTSVGFSSFPISSSFSNSLFIITFSFYYCNKFFFIPPRRVPGLLSSPHHTPSFCSRMLNTCDFLQPVFNLCMLFTYNHVKKFGQSMKTCDVCSMRILLTLILLKQVGCATFFLLECTYLLLHFV